MRGYVLYNDLNIPGLYGILPCRVVTSNKLASTCTYLMSFQEKYSKINSPIWMVQESMQESQYVLLIESEVMICSLRKKYNQIG